MDSDQQEQKRKEADRMITVGLETMESILSRQDQIKDPMTRNMIFVNYLCMMVDMASGAFKTAMVLVTNDNLSDRTIKLAETVNEKLKSEVQNLLTWIQQPIYSPDHPIGNKMMKEAESDFTTRTAESLSEADFIDKIPRKWSLLGSETKFCIEDSQIGLDNRVCVSLRLDYKTRNDFNKCQPLCKFFEGNDGEKWLIGEGRVFESGPVPKISEKKLMVRILNLNGSWYGVYEISFYEITQSQRSEIGILTPIK